MAKTAVSINMRQSERNTEDVLGEDQFVYRRQKGIMYATGILRLI